VTEARSRRSSGESAPQHRAGAAARGRAKAAKTSKDVERFKPLLAKDEISQQQYDAALRRQCGCGRGESAAAQAVEAELDVRVRAESSRAGQVKRQQASAELATAETAPEQVKVTQARAAAAEAHVMQARAVVRQAEINLEHATVKAPTKGIVSRRRWKSVSWCSPDRR
jgi:membrane fusion protein (multidrug efflux system)